MSEEDRPTITAAGPEDAGAIAAILRANADEDTLLLQPADRVAAHIEEFSLIRAGEGAGDAIACAQLRVHRPTVVELMSVAVKPEHHGEGHGGALVRHCCDRALTREPAPELFWLATTSPGYFARLGFEQMSMWTVPLPILLGKLGPVLRQHPRRWPAALFGGQSFMRWVGPDASARAHQ